MRSQAQEEDEEKEYKVKKFEVITGGKEPPSTGDTWLEGLPIGTCFLVAKRAVNPVDFSLGLFRIAGRTEKTVILQTPEHPHPIYAKPINFCNLFLLHENLGELGTDEELNDNNRFEGDPGKSKD